MENLERNLNTVEIAHKSRCTGVQHIMDAWAFGWIILLEKGVLNK